MGRKSNSIPAGLQLRTRGWRILGGIGLGVAIGPLDTSVNIAFPAIIQSFDIPVETIQWVILCYVLTYASLLLGVGRLADAIGHRRVFLSGLVVSVAGFITCSFSQSFTSFLLARSLQGVGAALILGTGPALATLSFPESARSRVVGIYTLLFAAAAASGPLLGGILVDYWSWPAVFWYRIPIALVALVWVSLFVSPLPRSIGQNMGPQRASPQFDTKAALAVALVCLCALFFIHRVQHLGLIAGQTLGGLSMAVLCSIYLIRQQRRATSPLIPLHVLRQGRFLLANLSHALVQWACFTVFLLVPFYLVDHLGYDPRLGGILLAIGPLGTALAAPMAGRWVYRAPTETVTLLGTVFIVLGLGGIALESGNYDVVIFALCLLIQGVGLGLFQVANMDFIMAILPRTNQGVAGSLTMTMRTLGVVTGTSVGTLLFANFQDLSISEEAFTQAFRNTFVVATGIAVVAGGVMGLCRFNSYKNQR